MSVCDTWNKDTLENPNIKTSLSSEWTFKSPRSSPRSSSPPPSSRAGEAIFHKYNELINSRTNMTDAKQLIEPLEKPFDFFDDEEFAFGINLLRNNVACVGENITKRIQMSQEPWPDNVKLFQPYEVEQILLPDNASCLAVQAFLKMCNLPFEVEMRWNAEFMSPSGRVPFIKCGAFVVSELEPIVQFAANKNVSLCARLSTEERAEMRAYMSLITNVLVNAELYISWVDQDTFNAVTRVRNSSVYPWPLGWLQTRSKRSSVIKRLKALHWHDKILDQVLADVEQCCNSLSQRLGDRDYFFGTPTPLDALIYGHVRALLSATGPKAALMIKPLTSALLRHLLRISNLTQMKLTPQEEYLVSQGCQICCRRISPDRSVSRQKRSRLCVRSISRENTAFNKDIFGFKPFASKKMIIMTSEKGNIMCRYDGPKKCVINEENDFIIDLINEIIDKVDEIIEHCYNHDFEVIAYPNDNFEKKINDYLDTIDEGTDVTGLDIGEEEIQVIDGLIDTMIDGDLDSDATVTDDFMESGATDTECEKDIFVDTSEVNEDKYHDLSEKNSIIIYDGKGPSQGRSNSKSSLGLSSGSNSTVRMQIENEEMSVENLLKHLRRYNAVYNIQEADVD
ncbi:uncharacterized protein LOC123879030 isoform X1 [Maniola jurtina]|uniref:uncharacterized protein LOC123879030 isoform X1 n=1 Tax=Maniola jurtina TaxID=191418 RepID=UPI001E686F18|nr:uncharacterized protein LOC123879030 isoform X1 [Maniola jurtina]